MLGAGLFRSIFEVLPIARKSVKINSTTVCIQDSPGDHCLHLNPNSSSLSNWNGSRRCSRPMGLYKQIYTTCFQPSITKPFAMSTPSNNEQLPRKGFKQKFRSVFSSIRSPSRNLEVQSTSTNVPPINSPSDGPRIIADRPGSGKKIG